MLAINRSDNDNWKIVAKINELILSLYNLRNEWTYVIEFMFVQIVNKEYLVFDFLLLFVSRIRRNTNEELFLKILCFSIAIIGFVLTGLNQFRDLNVPIFQESFADLIKIDLDVNFKERHDRFCLKNRLSTEM